MNPRAATREPIDTTAEVETPEHVRFRHVVAGPSRRLLAYLVDTVIRVAIMAVVFLGVIITGLTSSESLSSASSGVTLFVFFLVEWGYYVFFEMVMGGRSPGKKVASLRVVTEGGHPLSFGNSALRNLLRAADLLPPLVGGGGAFVVGSYALGLVSSVADRRFRRLGDLVGGTIVIVDTHHAVTAPLRLNPPPTPAEERWIPTRVPLSGDELDAIDLFLRRSGKLSQARVIELAEMVAPIFAQRMGLRYRDPVRFLALLHHRAHAHEGRAA